MALRSFGVQTLTGVAQPVMSDVTTAAVLVPPSGVDAYITVASNTFYQVGDRIVLEPRTTNQDSYRVIAKVTGTGSSSTTVMQCSLEGGSGHAHASGVVIQIAIPAIDVVVTPVDGGAGPVFIGADNTVTVSNGGTVCTRLDKTAAGTQANAWHMAGGTDHNIVDTAEAWMIGTLADLVYVYALVQ